MKKSNLILGIIVLIIVLGLATYGFIFKSHTRLKENLEKNVIKNEVTNIGKLEPQENNEGGVVVSIAPQNIFVDASIWDFRISLSTHSVDLFEDLMQVSSLFDDNGNEYKPVQWEGSPIGGHHREGILKFKVIIPMPQYIKLEIRGVGGIPMREFRWDLVEPKS